MQRIHSLYHRTLSDLPWQGRRVTLRVSSFRLYCNTAGCRRRTFVIPLSDMAVPYGRHTMRLTDLHHYVAHALGGSAGARMAERLRCPVSADTLIRRLLSRMSGKPPARPPRVLGMDDWAWRRAHHRPFRSQTDGICSETSRMPLWRLWTGMPVQPGRSRRNSVSQPPRIPGCVPSHHACKKHRRPHGMRARPHSQGVKPDSMMPLP
ncbi:hypothetical protein [Komagataeibacter europaeus]|uniref:hypothetical protein n=1 Tax=Komagataeibacter europaeus TaxID=33995 RepID=UPI001E30BD57|nr:hypothetical protein [Komagataeibacter europaeus]